VQHGLARPDERQVAVALVELGALLVDGEGDVVDYFSHLAVSWWAAVIGNPVSAA
jgi:hypothetical protein